MSHAGAYIKTGMAFLNKLEEGKPHTSVTDWIEVLSGDRYEELSLDGIPELVESVNIQGAIGTQEASRAIRKKLKYGNVHRQIRALVLLRALTENASKGFQLNWANTQIMERLKEMATDTLLDPKVKKRLMLVFHAWSIQYAGESRMSHVQRLYGQYSGQPVRRGSVAPVSAHTSQPTSPTTSTAPRSRNTFGDIDDIYGHSWEPSAGARSGGANYSDLAAAKADAESRRAARDRQILIEQREAELERREREMKRKADMAALEARRQKDAAEETERRRLMKENMKRGGAAAQAKPKVKFDLQKEKPNIMVSVATAIQAANNLVNSMRHLNREHENLLESPRVQDNLDKAKAARRTVIRYVQVVNDEELVGTLLEANEKVVEAIQMYDKMSKPAALDSDSEHEGSDKDKKSHARSASQAAINSEKEMDVLTRRMEAQRLEALRTNEMQKMQERQKRESAREAQRREKGRPTRYEQTYGGGAYGNDLADLDFGSGATSSGKLPRPISPDSERGSFGGGNLSDFSDENVDYDSSDEEYRRQTQSRNQSRRQSYAAPAPSRSRRASQSQPMSPATATRRAPPQPQQYKSLRDDDPFADDGQTPMQENKRMQWAEI